MKKSIMLLAAALLAAGPAQAKDKLIKLAPADAALLKDKTIALTVHERPSFIAMTAGKASFGLIGLGAMISAGNKIVDENRVPDPAALVRRELGDALAKAYDARLAPVDTTPTKAEKAKDLAALHPDADYVLDVRSGGWNFAYYPTSWGTYWVGYSAQVQLVDAKTGRQVSNAACNTNTHDNPHPASREALLADDARLLKDVTAGLGWTCVQLLAREQFAIPAERIVATPANLVDPLAPSAQVAGASPADAATPAPTSAEAPVAPPVEAAPAPADVAPAAPEPAAAPAGGNG